MDYMIQGKVQKQLQSDKLLDTGHNQYKSKNENKEFGDNTLLRDCFVLTRKLGYPELVFSQGND